MIYNFDKVDTIDSRGTPYDYHSVMHYNKNAFGENGKLTMETRDKYYQDLIGTGLGFSHMDIKQINMVYKCPVYTGDLPVVPTPECHDKSSYCEMYKWWGRCKEAVYERDCPIACDMCIPGKPRTPKPTEKPTPKPCVDKADYCQGIQDRCSEDGAKDWMRDNCKSTCGYCNGGGGNKQCKDKSDYCAANVDRCTEEAAKDWMKENCENTCGYCGGGPNPSQCKDNWHNCLSNMDRCHEDWFKRECKKTCNWCNGGTGPPCKDRWGECEAQKGRCTEKNVFDWMKTHCKKTCGHCP